MTKYYWTIIMANGQKYIVLSEEKNVAKFVNYVFGTTGALTLSTHDLKDGGNVIIASNQVSSIEFNGLPN